MNKYLLYYEAIPFNIAYLKSANTSITISQSKLGKLLREVVSDLIDFNIYFELDIDYLGFNELG